MINTVKDIGNRREVPEQYEAAARYGNQLVIFYTVTIQSPDNSPCRASFYPEHTVARHVPRWGVIDLSSGWSVLKEQLDTAWDSGQVHSISTRNESRPDINSKEYVNVPISSIDWFHQGNNEYPQSINANKRRSQQIIDCVKSSQYCINFPYGTNPSDFFIVINDNNTVKYKFVRKDEQRYYTSWAKPIQIILYPFSFIFDVATFPLQLPAYMCM